MGDARHRERRNDHQDDGAQALGPGCPAEEQPPHDDGKSTGDSTEDAEAGGARRDQGQEEHDQPSQHHGDHAGPEP